MLTVMVWVLGHMVPVE